MNRGPDPSGPAPSGSAAARHRRSDATLVRALPDGLLLLAPGATEPIVVTGPAADLWELMGTAVTFDEVVATLASRYATDPQVVAHDLEPVWRRLLALDATTPA